MAKVRVETDSMGSVQIPADALFGAQTARAVENFAVSGWPMPREFIAALGLVKEAAAEVNRDSGRLDAAKADAIIAAAREVVEGRLDGHFVVDVFQTGSGTSTNMNANEVIANRAAELLGGTAGDKGLIHPNDHVNMCQSSNDVIPTALRVSAANAIHHRLVPALRSLHDALEARAGELDHVVKVARTHLMDAVPIRLGQEFSGYAAQIDNCLGLLGGAVGWLCELPIGGTAVGTGLNAPADFAGEVCSILSDRLNLPFQQAGNRFEAQAAQDAAAAAAAALRSVALALGKIASDIRLMASGPRCGLGELILPALQPGSSMMPGKVNPVICESVVQVACQVVGCDAAVAAGATGGVGGILELNVAMPMIAWNLLTAARLLANVTRTFEDRCIRGLRADEDRCRRLVEQSTALVTALAPRLGYDAAAEIAKEAFESGKTIRQVCLQRGALPESELNELLDPRRQTGN
jgi:fumarate hydratase class II